MSASDDSINSHEVAMNLSVARAQLHLSAMETKLSDKDQELLISWFEHLTIGYFEEAERLAFAASFSLDLTEVSWRVAGPTPMMLVPMGHSAVRLGVAADPMTRFGEIGEEVRPTTVGMAIQAGASGSDAEWFIPEDVSPDELDGLDLSAPFRSYVDGDTNDLIAVCGGIGSTQYMGGTRWLPEGAELNETYVEHGAQPLPADVLVALTELHRGPFAVSQWFSETGPVKFGLIAVDPPVELLLALANYLPDGQRPEDGRLAEIVGSLGTEAPSTIELENWPDGLRIRFEVPTTTL